MYIAITFLPLGFFLLSPCEYIEYFFRGDVEGSWSCLQSKVSSFLR